MAKYHFYSLWLAGICILFFLLQLIVPGFTDALVLNQQALQGEVWRFITSIFLHGSLSHLIFNLFALVLFGLILERFTNKFLWIFFISGVIANLISVFFYPSSLGASGAIFGIIGALAVMRPMMTVWAFSLPLPMFIAAIIWAVTNFLGIFAPSEVGNIAHLSGMLVGLLFGAFLRAGIKEERVYRHKVDIPEHTIRRWETLYLERN